VTEKSLQKVFTGFLLLHKIYYIKTISCSKAGAPDIIACISGAFWAFELKGNKGKESELQIYNGEKIKQSGGNYFMLNPQNYCEITNKILEIKK
jgi:alanyl-tRNA synthetase